MAKKTKKIEKKEKKAKGTTHNLVDFAKEISKSKETDLKSGEIATVLKLFFGAVTETVTSGQLEPGDSINMPGLGKLNVVLKKARKARNPATGEKLKIPERPGVKFRLAGPLRTYGKPKKEPVEKKKGKKKLKKKD